MTIFLTLAIYSVRIASDFPTQGDYIPIISIYFILGLLFTFISLLWFTYAEYLRTKIEKPKMMVKLARLLTCLPLISWMDSKRKNKIFVKPIAETDEANNFVSVINIFIFCITLSTSLISNIYIWSSLITND